MTITHLTIILPCHNEVDNIPLWEQHLRPILNALACPVECVVVDDGSTDDLSQTIQAFSASWPELRLISHEKRLGLGAAIRSGIATAQGDAVCILDADLTFSPSLIPQLMDQLKPGVDCVCASPFMGRFEGVSVVRKCLSVVVNAMYRLLLGQKLTSVSAICRLYRKSALDQIELTSQSFDINAEIILSFLKKGFHIVEIPAVLGVRKNGTSKISVAREIFNHLRMFSRIIQWRTSSGTTSNK